MLPGNLFSAFVGSVAEKDKMSFVAHACSSKRNKKMKEDFTADRKTATKDIAFIVRWIHIGKIESKSPQFSSNLDNILLNFITVIVALISTFN